MIYIFMGTLVLVLLVDGVIIKQLGSKVKRLQTALEYEKICCFCRHQQEDLTSEYGNPVCAKCFDDGDGIPGLAYEIREDLK